MAKLGIYTDDEGASLFAATEWTVSTALSVASGAVAEKLLNERTQYISLYASVDCYFRFDTLSGDTVVTANDVRIAKNGTRRIKVPRGLGNTIYFHVTPVDSESGKTVKLVEE